MGQDPSEIRQEIEDTRARMGDTVDAIGYKTDVKTRVKGSISDKKDAVLGRKDEMTSRVGERMPDKEAAKQRARRVSGMAQQNPLGLAVAGAAVGFLAGLAVPSTQMEDERIGEVADEVKDRVRETSQEAVERGKQVAQEATSAATQTAKERGQEQSQELASSAQEKAQQVRSEAGPGS